ncbi:AMP-binding protein [Niveispirillum sp.]|uniref:AMP-binding protein n=1 Tax=Niveispirillum sp. TaxID=1917217 RepID=UPI001B63901D|nr:AMP-binding protein [Niveispirillum sp.]MBP7338509.1 AMP-binding protein [Niveispirillum sp.]
MNDWNWADPAVPDRDRIVLRYVLERWAAERPEQTYAVFPGGDRWSFREMADRARRFATGLARLGVGRGDRVMSWLPNGQDALCTWFGANWLGAVYTPINTAYKGSLLRNAIDIAQPRVLVCHSSLVSRLGAVGLDPAVRVVLIDLEEDEGPHRGRFSLDGDIDEGLLRLTVPIEPWDEQAIIYTSGTTGPSKGVLSSYCHGATAALAAFEEMDADGLRYLITLPLFHAGGTIGTIGTLLLGRSIALPERFETARFWDMVRETAATCCTLLGAMATFLVKQPPDAGDCDHGLRWAYILPHGTVARDFAARFGVATRTLFNMTEIAVPILSPVNPSDAESCGRARAGVTLRLADAHDRPVALGEVGELLIRLDRPWSLSHGYAANPAATAASWRNGWFHTGDLFRQSADGEFYFVDRTKDAIRRRGENISSYEVERECLSHEAVREAAAYAVASDYGEDEVMVALSPVPGHQIDPFAVIAHLRNRVPYYMVPRFIRLMAELPKTPTAKIQKPDLRAEGRTPDTWDREAHGLIIKGERIGG